MSVIEAAKSDQGLPTISDSDWRDLLERRVTDPGSIAKAYAARRRPPRVLSDRGTLFLVAADHRLEPDLLRPGSMDQAVPHALSLSGVGGEVPPVAALRPVGGDRGFGSRLASLLYLCCDSFVVILSVCGLLIDLVGQNDNEDRLCGHLCDLSA